MRSFLAIPIPDEVADPLEDLQARCSVGRLVPAENFHITLAFLGDQPEGGLAALCDELGRLSPEPPDIRFDSVGVFGGADPRSVYAAIRENGHLSALRTAVRRAARSVDIVLPHARFVPHVTLARFPRRWPAGSQEALARFIAGAAGYDVPGFRADRFCLYESRLSVDGARYDILAEFPLGPARD